MKSNAPMGNRSSEHEPLGCPHGRLPMNGEDGWKHCPHCLGLNNPVPQSEVKPRVGMLRQWLNEDRITDPKKMVTNEDLEYWLKVAEPKESPVSQSVECKTCYGTGRYGANGESPCPDCSQSVEGWEKRFDELNIHISQPNSLAEEKRAETMKYFFPLAWDLFKPSVKDFIHSEIENVKSTTLSTLVKEMEGLKKSMLVVGTESDSVVLPKNAHSRTYNTGISAAIEVVKKMV